MFSSILFPYEHDAAPSFGEEPPGCFADLRLDRVLLPLLNQFSTYHLEPYYLTPAPDRETVLYRQAVMRDLENESAAQALDDFAWRMFRLDDQVKSIRETLSGGAQANALARAQCLEAAEIYCGLVERTAAGLEEGAFRSDGLCEFVRYLRAYAASDAFSALRAEAGQVREKLNAVRYCMLIKGNQIRVKRYEGQEDYAKRIAGALVRFRQDASLYTYGHIMNETPLSLHTEAAVLDAVAGLYPDEFAALADFCLRHAGFVDRTAARFSREVRFYFAWLRVIRPLKRKGLPFCYPKLADGSGDMYCEGFFDIALALEAPPGRPLIRNGYTLHGGERIMVVTGPNQSGKTTFARSVGQLHYLAGLGCCVPGTGASLLLCDSVETHFDREEETATWNGKLKNELIRLKAIIDHASPNTLVIVNDILTSTTLHDALLIGSKIMDKFQRSGCMAVCVTSYAQLSEHGPETVGISSVPQEDGSYRMARQKARQGDEALRLAERYGLTYEALYGRLKV